MRRHHVVCLAFVVSAGALVSAQTWPAIPPIPLQERFRVRTDLTVTLMLDASPVMAGDSPIFTLAFRNVGTRTLRVPPYVSTDSNVRLRVFDSSGGELRSAVSCTLDGVPRLSSVSSYWRIEPGRARVLSLDYPCGGLPALPAGDYQFEATYRNSPDWRGAYDVYEQGASETWDGRITTPRVALKVLPLDAKTEQSLIAILDTAGSPDGVNDAIRRLGLSGTASVMPALLRRFDRDRNSRLDVALALVQLSEPDAAAALGEAIERLPFEERWRFSVPTMQLYADNWLLLVRRATGCSALPFVMNLLDQRYEALRVLNAKCADLRDRLVNASEPPSASDPAESRRLAERASRAASLLKLLDSPVIPRPSTPSSGEFFPEEIHPDPAAVSEYVDDLIAGIDDEQTRERALKGVARFGTIDDFIRLKGVFATRDEESRWLLQEALTEMTFISDRDAFPSRQAAYWDAWWKQHADTTRLQWAREALQRDRLRSEWVTHDQAPSRAAAFLLATQGLSPALVRELAQHRSYLVRLALANDVAKADARSGGRLFIRELSNRYIGACAAGNERLELLVRQRYRFDCWDPSQRRQAIAHWTTVVESIEPGFLPLTVARLAR